MILVVGQSNYGKSEIAESLVGGSRVITHDQIPTYSDKVDFLASLKCLKTVIDGVFFDELLPSSTTLTLKQKHNLTLLMLTLDPVIVFCDFDTANKNARFELLSFLLVNKIQFFSCDANTDKNSFVDSVKEIHAKRLSGIRWWVKMWREKVGFIGSQHPETLIVGERIGPNNTHSIPFEVGPTGKMMSDMLQFTGYPLGVVAITNIIKEQRRENKSFDKNDKAKFETGLRNLKPSKVILMGAQAKKFGAPIVESEKIEYATIEHFGYLNHRGIVDLNPYYSKWQSRLQFSLNEVCMA